MPVGSCTREVEQVGADRAASDAAVAAPGLLRCCRRSAAHDATTRSGVLVIPLPQSRLAPLRRLAAKLRNRLRDLLTRSNPDQRAKRRIDREFDSRFGVDTGGTTYLSGLKIDSPRRRHGVNHWAMDPGEMDAALASLDIDHARFTFVDFGAGKGRAMLMASVLPFQRILGVEFAPELHRQAVDNIRRWKHPGQRCRNLESVCMDAATYELPDEPLVVFLYNPFGAEVMREVANNVVNSLRKRPRELYVLYANPFQAEAWLQAGFVEKARGDTFALFVLKPQ